MTIDYDPQLLDMDYEQLGDCMDFFVEKIKEKQFEKKLIEADLDSYNTLLMQASQRRRELYIPIQKS